MISEFEPDVMPGIYRHFKGGLYQVHVVAALVDSGKEYVVYRKLESESSMFLRDRTEFVERVNIGGTVVPRFQFVSGAANDLIKCTSKPRVRIRRAPRQTRPSLVNFSNSEGIK